MSGQPEQAPRSAGSSASPSTPAPKSASSPLEEWDQLVARNVASSDFLTQADHELLADMGIATSESWTHSVQTQSRAKSRSGGNSTKPGRPTSTTTGRSRVPAPGNPLHAKPSRYSVDGEYEGAGARAERDSDGPRPSSFDLPGNPFPTPDSPLGPPPPLTTTTPRTDGHSTSHAVVSEYDAMSPGPATPAEPLVPAARAGRTMTGQSSSSPRSSLESPISEANRRALVDALMQAQSQQSATAAGAAAAAAIERPKPARVPKARDSFLDTNSFYTGSNIVPNFTAEPRDSGSRYSSLRGRIVKRSGAEDVAGLPPPIITPRSSMRSGVMVASIPGGLAHVDAVVFAEGGDEVPHSGGSVIETPQTMYSGSASSSFNMVPNPPSSHSDASPDVSAGSGSGSGTGSSQPFVSARSHPGPASPGGFQWPTPVEEEPKEGIPAPEPPLQMLHHHQLPSPTVEAGPLSANSAGSWSPRLAGPAAPSPSSSTAMSILSGFGLLNKFGKDKDKEKEKEKERDKERKSSDSSTGEGLIPIAEKKPDSQGMLGKMFSGLSIMSGSRKVSPSTGEPDKSVHTPPTATAPTPSSATTPPSVPGPSSPRIEIALPQIPEMSIDTVVTPVTPTFPAVGAPILGAPSFASSSSGSEIDRGNSPGNPPPQTMSEPVMTATSKGHQRIRSLRDYGIVQRDYSSLSRPPPAADPRRISRFPSASEVKPKTRPSPDRSAARSTSPSGQPAPPVRRRSSRGVPEFYAMGSASLGQLPIHRAGTMPRLGKASLEASSRAQIPIDRTRSSASLGRKGGSSQLYVGNRPPSEVILDNLELYFPAISNDTIMGSSSAESIDEAPEAMLSPGLTNTEAGSEAGFSLQGSDEGLYMEPLHLPPLGAPPLPTPSDGMSLHTPSETFPSRTPSPAMNHFGPFDPMASIRSTSSIQSNGSLPSEYQEIDDNFASLGGAASLYKARIRQAIEAKHLQRESSVTLERRRTDKQKHVVNIMQQLSEFRRARREMRSQDLSAMAFSRNREYRLSSDSMRRLMKSEDLTAAEGEEIDPIFESLKRDAWSKQVELDAESGDAVSFTEAGHSSMPPSILRRPSRDSTRSPSQPPSILHSTERIAKEMALSTPGAESDMGKAPTEPSSEVGSIAEGLAPQPFSTASLERRRKAVAFQSLDEDKSPIQVPPAVFATAEKADDASEITKIGVSSDMQLASSAFSEEDVAKVPSETVDLEDSEASSVDSIQMSPPYEHPRQTLAQRFAERDYFNSKPLVEGAMQVSTPGMMTPAMGSPGVVLGGAATSLPINRTASSRSLGFRSHLLNSISQSPSLFRWVKGELIGKGSFGSVFHGLNLDTGEFMAVKQVPLIQPKMVKDESAALRQRQKFVEALRNEIELLTGIQHDNVVRYLGFEVTSEHVNVFLEYVSGGSIASMLGGIGSFDEPLVRSLVYQILCGLEYLHERGIIHRDIKGANILLDEQGTAKITDFGISKRSEMAYKWNSRMSVQGSVFWMAPEVIRGKGYSAKVDIWSLGCLVIEMFTGQHPWCQFQDQTAALYRLGQPNPRPHIPSELPLDAQDFLDKCFTLDPELRPTAAELLDHPFCQLDESFDYAEYVESQKERILEEEQDDEDMYDDGTYSSNASEPMEIDSDTEGRAGFEIDGSDDEEDDDIEDGVDTDTFLHAGADESGTVLYAPLGGHNQQPQANRRDTSTMTPVMDSPASGHPDSGWMSGGLATGPDGQDVDADDGQGKEVSIDDEASATPLRSQPELDFDQLVPSDAESLTPTAVEFARGPEA